MKSASESSASSEVIEQLLIALFARGHCLLVGVPGLAKTLLIRTLAEALSLAVQPHSVHARPDADRHHRHRGDPGRPDDRRPRRFVFCPGRCSPTSCSPTRSTARRPRRRPRCSKRCRSSRSRSAASGIVLPDPFFVLATQNPIEQEGTYPLPEAQLDRFMFMVLVDYPTEDEELEIVKRTTSRRGDEANSDAFGRQTCSSFRTSCGACRWPTIWPGMRFSLRGGRASATATCPRWCANYVSWGAGPRASQNLILAAKARAVLNGRYYVSGDDIRAVAPPVLRHRIVTNFNAEADGIKPDDIVAHLAETIPVAADDHAA